MEGLGLLTEMPKAMLQQKLPDDLVVELARLTSKSVSTLKRHRKLIDHYVGRLVSRLETTGDESPGNKKFLKDLITSIRLCLAAAFGS